ncbi:hypothetical protein FJV80_23795 [Mesorhizobium sp. WSM4310]|uniref:hypothetical protein n=1 Tax=Mesorhizobium sp. WSM4310 TaxID=2589883 RepID=UPI00115DBECE|nr:hypothetical protein [Mesorhizobium sp. WSM4310]TRC79138.1 hypothetical protein FJV80_23795 [Mesorhizobium sp. WSM4310]
MNERGFTSIIKKILPQLRGYKIYNGLVYKSPVDDLLMAITYNSSSNDKNSFYIQYFFIPLFVPTESLHFAFGDRAVPRPGVTGWYYDMPNLTEEIRLSLLAQALPFLNNIKSPGDAARTLKSRSQDNPHIRRAIAFCAAREGNVDEAVRELDQLISSVKIRTNWELEIKETAILLREKLIVGIIEANDQLNSWRSKTIENLKLEKIVQK